MIAIVGHIREEDDGYRTIRERDRRDCGKDEER
jgi:hypothetical protein